MIHNSKTHMTTHEARRALNVSLDTFWRLVRNGTIQVDRKIGIMNTYRRAHIERVKNQRAGAVTVAFWRPNMIASIDGQTIENVYETSESNWYRVRFEDGEEMRVYKNKPILINGEKDAI